MDYTIKIGGEAGEGIQTIGDTLAKVFSRNGYHVFTHQDYESRIRGGHNFYQIRFSDQVISASRTKTDILVALDRASISLHKSELTDQGYIIYDSSTLKEKHEEKHFLDVPFVSLAIEHGRTKIMANTAAVGAVLGILGVRLDSLIGIFKETFSKKGDQIVQGNINAAQAGHAFSVNHCPSCSFASVPASQPKMLVNGIEGISLGAISAGCKFYAAYPMTPSTGIMNFLAGKSREYGIVVEQAEDEISAINMALGASFAGVRSMTGTSGGGFSLMVEGLGLAAMTETPVVIALGQRPGPATGLPTRTEQSELLFPMHAAQGEFPRVILAPGSPEQALYLTNKAFDLAEKFQITSIVIFDQYLADTAWTYDKLDLSSIKYTDYRLKGEAFRQISGYKRHAFTETGVSPLGIPGESTNLVVTDSDEHDEEGHIIEDAETRTRMVEKRIFKKLPLIKKEINPPLLHGDQHADIILVGWGSTFGIMKEVVRGLSNKSISMLHFSELYPFPMVQRFDFVQMLEKAKRAICIENNATGQFARLIRAETGYAFPKLINKYDGRPFLIEELMGEINAYIG